MTRDDVIREFMQGRNCAQCVLGAYAGETGYDPEETDRVASCFGGGMLMGQTCGAVTGALMAVGLLGGGREQTLEFEKQFQERFGTCVCQELLDHIPLAQAKESGKMLEVCPNYVKAAVEIVDGIMGVDGHI